MKSIAVCISGQIRTGVFKEQILFFTRFLSYLRQEFHVDVYLVLKLPQQETSFIQSEQGMQHFNELLQVLHPLHKVFLHDFYYEEGQNAFCNGQLKMIDMCIQAALEYKKYDLFFRVRPDACFLLNELHMDEKHENYIYTSIKEDAPASDQVFLFNQHMLEHWWKPMVQTYQKHTFVRTYLEYTIFPTSLVKQSFQCWLIRDYDNTTNWCWSRPHVPLHSEYTWGDKELYHRLLLPISHEHYVNELLKIVPVIYTNVCI
jgi:hypothetical protein